MRKKKCTKCGEVKSLKDYYIDKRRNSYRSQCKECEREVIIKRRNTEIGFLTNRYNNMRRNPKTQKRGRNNKRLFTFDEFLTAFEKHKSIYGMRSAWGPGIDHLDQHLPLTTITPGTKRTNGEKTPRIMSNVSPDRLDSNRDYTLQNIIFIRNDENTRKKDTSYNDCKIQIRLHEERFMKKKDII
tara:strand:+ start:54 stop:608 length:555 start_codon:yes stop_codon:yes gene_type:complete